jgi:hypothetical protein
LNKGRIPLLPVITAGNLMAGKLDPSELVEFRELLMANSIQVDTLAQLSLKRGLSESRNFR